MLTNILFKLETIKSITFNLLKKIKNDVMYINKTDTLF